MQANDGGLIFTSGGISFGDDILDKHLKGTWTPVMTVASPGGTPPSFTYSAQQGKYTIIGDVCFFTLRVAYTAMTLGTGSGDARISLPFTVNGTYANVQTIRTSSVDLPGTPVSQTFTIINGQSFGIISSVQDNGAIQTLQASALAANNDFRASGFFFL